MPRRVLLAIVSVLAGASACASGGSIVVSPVVEGDRPEAIDPQDAPFAGSVPDTASPTELPTIGDGPVGPEVGEHWHVAYGLYICGEFLPAIVSENDPVGIHTHGDGVIHVHPFVESAAGDNATLGVFLETVGLELLVDNISVPAGLVTTPPACRGDETTQIAIWDTPDDPDPQVVKAADIDLASLPFRSDRAVITIMLAATGEQIPQPPSVPQLDALTDVAPSIEITRPPDGFAISGPTECPAADGSSPRVTSFSEAPPVCIEAGVVYQAVVETTAGSFTVELDPSSAPVAVNNFVVLARYHFYDGTAFHGIIPGFVALGGDATGEPVGNGDPGYLLAEEPPPGPYGVGAVAMNSFGPTTTGSQFFVVLGTEPPIAQDFSLIGQVIDGFETLDVIGEAGSPSGAPVAEIRITSISIQVAG